MSLSWARSGCEDTMCTAKGSGTSGCSLSHRGGGGNGGRIYGASANGASEAFQFFNADMTRKVFGRQGKDVGVCRHKCPWRPFVIKAVGQDTVDPRVHWYTVNTEMRGLAVPVYQFIVLIFGKKPRGWGSFFLPLYPVLL